MQACFVRATEHRVDEGLKEEVGDLQSATVHWLRIDFSRGLSRYRPMKGFKNPFCALNCCTALEEIRQLFRMKNKTRGERRKMIAPRINRVNKLMTSDY